jgi:hypothetical protein
MTRTTSLIGFVFAVCLTPAVAKAGGQQPTSPPPASPPNQQKWFVEIAPAGGGFAGIREDEVLLQEHLLCTGQATPQACTVDPNSQVLVRNSRYTFRPTLSTGLVFRRLLKSSGRENEDSFGIGVGGHLVFLSSSAGSVQPAPAATIHFGTLKSQLFVGILGVPTDKVVFPNGADSIVVPKGTDTSNLLLKGYGNSVNFFVGVVIGGMSVTKGG